MSPDEREQCPACGGAGGGPFGRVSSGWDVETYECTRCEGWGYLREAASTTDDEHAPMTSMPRPGIAKASPDARALEEKKRRASGA